MDWPGDATLTAFGRQALSLVAQELRKFRVTSLLAPDYYCPTMLVPFSMEGIHVHVVETGHDCLMRSHALDEALRTHRGSAVLHCETFGSRADEELADVLCTARQAGTKVVIDRTHSWPEPGEDSGDYIVASLRKMVPTPDGAYVTGLRLPPRVIPNEATRRATRARMSHLANPTLETFEAAEDLADDAWVPAPPSLEAMSRVDEFDHESDRTQRARTAAALRHALTGMDIVNPDASCCVALSHPRAHQIMDTLAARGVHGPIYWGQPLHLPHTRRWRDDVFTLPVDERWAGREDELASWVRQAAG
ncbi:hypothetical protein GCM10009785_27490 [Brooklawnia cerclae]|uniref:Uncharacterized protein n=1 Tax=Brooklawnia cerclae TaxID=349934 RepID=A0ABX0SEZ2_9ACTN|nr:hypothetical protein [Brooklawnia cerclae]NIH56960.1 hypothetical protein [Brooklawnia cerclae]